MVSIFIRGMDLKPPIDGVTEDHHGLSHHGRNPAKIEQLRIVERTEMAAFRDFLDRRCGTQRKAAATLLDQTQVLIGSNLGDASGHGTSNLPILLAGGGFKHGQHIAGDREQQHAARQALRQHAATLRRGDRPVRLRHRNDQRPELNLPDRTEGTMNRLRCPLLFVGLVAFPRTCIAADAAAAFQSRVLPVLKANCSKCHGDTRPKAKVNLASLAHWTS